VRRAILHARKTGGSVAMLLNLRSLCHPDRTPRFQRCPPTAICALDDLTCWPEGKPVSRYARIARQQYDWAVWHPGKVQRSTFWWLATQPFRGPLLRALFFLISQGKYTVGGYWLFRSRAAGM
jgi:hypothetical protein